MIVSQDDWNNHAINEYAPPEFVGKLFLLDAHGRKLSFKEVGSGIGYVLPVLIESFKSAKDESIVFLQ